MTTLFQVTIIDHDELGAVLRTRKIEVSTEVLLDILPPRYIDADGTQLPSSTTYVFKSLQVQIGGDPGLVDWELALDPRPPCPPPTNDI